MEGRYKRHKKGVRGSAINLHVVPLVVALRRPARVVVDRAKDLEDEVLALGEDGAEDGQVLLDLFARLLDPKRCAEHAAETSDDGLVDDVVDRRTVVGGFVEHAVEENDEFVREAGEVDVGEVVGTELVPRGTVVGEDDVGGGFEDDEAEAANKGLRQ